MTPMVSPRLHEAFEISFHGTRVQSLHVVEVDIKNVGNAPIRSADYEAPLRVVCGEDTVGSAQIVARRPPDLDPSLAVEAAEVGIAPLLLKPATR
jgi:hypothetical protein